MKLKLVSIFALLSAMIYGQNPEYDELLSHYHSKNNFNGVVLIASDSKIEYLNAIGFSDRENKIQLTTQSTFKIASVTKAFTAVLILQLYESGKLDLKSPFGKYYPNYKGEAKNTVTIENLLTYSSGIPDDAGKFDMKPYQVPMSIDEFINLYCSGKLENKPGKVSNYSNTEYIILHKIIENITGNTFEVEVKKKILEPLNLKNTNMLKSKDSMNQNINSYSIIDSTNQVFKDEPYLIENFFGAGAMYSTAEDLLKFDNALFENKILKQSTANLMIAPNKELDNVAFGVWYASGYGTFSEPFIYRTGGILGACSNWIHTINDKKCIIVLSNTNSTNLFELSEQLYLISKGMGSTILNKDKN